MSTIEETEEQKQLRLKQEFNLRKMKWRLENQDKIKAEWEEHIKTRESKKLEEMLKQQFDEQDEAHKEKARKYYAEYSKLNQDKIHAKARCEICDCEVNRKMMLRHTRSKKHIDNESLKNSKK